MAEQAAIAIPDDIEAATGALNSIGDLITAHKWQRAAIVYAFTGDDTPGPKTDRGDRGKSTAVSCREFASLGISGLRSDQTVRRYRKAWAWAVETDQALRAVPGVAVALPDVAWEWVPTPEARQPDAARMVVGGQPARNHSRGGEPRGGASFGTASDAFGDASDASEADPREIARDWIAAADEAIRLLAEHRITWQFLTTGDLDVLRGAIAAAGKLLPELHRAVAEEAA